APASGDRSTTGPVSACMAQPETMALNSRRLIVSFPNSSTSDSDAWCRGEAPAPRRAQKLAHRTWAEHYLWAQMASAAPGPRCSTRELEKSDVDGAGAEADFAIGQVIFPHAAEALVEAERLDLGPGAQEPVAPFAQGPHIAVAERFVVHEF